MAKDSHAAAAAPATTRSGSASPTRDKTQDAAPEKRKREDGHEPESPTKTTAPKKQQVDPSSKSPARSGSSPNRSDISIDSAAGSPKSKSPLRSPTARSQSGSPMQTTITSAMHASKIASAESSPSRQPKTDTSHSQSQSLPNTAASGSTASAGSPTLKAEADEPNAKAESPKAKTEPAASTPAKSSFGIQQSSLGFFSSASRSDTHGSGNGSTSSPFASFASSAASGSAFGSATASSESKPFGSGSGSGFTSFASGHASGLSFGSAAAGSSSFASILSTPSSTKSMFGAPKAKTQDSKADRDDAGDDDEGDAEPNEDGDTEEFGKYAQVTLEQKQVVTGEEDETTIHSSRCKLFVWDGENWRERGAGHLRINQKTSSAGSSGHARLVMRADGILRVILNVRIPAGMPHVLRNERFIEILTPEPGNAKPSKLVFRFANSDITSTFFSVLESVIPPSKA